MLDPWPYKGRYIEKGDDKRENLASPEPGHDERTESDGLLSRIEKFMHVKMSVPGCSGQVQELAASNPSRGQFLRCTALV
jgi:hypothetical protein